MNCIPNNYSNTNFQAKLDINRIKGSKNRWKDIAKNFEKMTAENTEYTLKGYDSFDSGLAFDLVNKNNVVLNDCCFSAKGSQKLAELSNTEIAKKITKLFDLLTKKSEIEAKANYEFQKSGIANSSIVKENYFWNSISKKINKIAEKTFNEDDLLRKGLLYY